MAAHLPIYNKDNGMSLSDAIYSTNNKHTKEILIKVDNDYNDGNIKDKPKSLYKNFDRRKHYVSLFREISNYNDYIQYRDNPEDNNEKVFIISQYWVDDEGYDYEVNVEIHIDESAKLVKSIYFVI